jgi:UDP-2-acetamido-3-amino-2,3-dideoxy-glucuronate N-acetyltransferase
MGDVTICRGDTSLQESRADLTPLLGANATIICGVTLGRYCFIGAGAVVNKNISDYALVVGNPARQIGWACECGERLPDDLECLICGKQYEKGPTGLVAAK